MMRVIAGRARGVKLNTVKGLKTRPTTDRVKEALFSMLQFDLADATVLDAFAGSGALGIEALSRGAEVVDFVDAAPACSRIIKQNLAKARLLGGNVYCVELADFLAGRPSRRYDVVLLDPPYAKNYVEKSINWLINGDNLNKNAIIVVEHNNAVELATAYGAYRRIKDKRYGITHLTVYRGGI